MFLFTGEKFLSELFPNQGCFSTEAGASVVCAALTPELQPQEEPGYLTMRTAIRRPVLPSPEARRPLRQSF